MIQTINQQKMSREVMKQYVLYKNPSDYPGKFVLREWHIVHGNPNPVPVDKPVMIEDNVDSIQKLMDANPNLYWLQRSKDDDPCILGTWI
jgi:hypothetical protein